MCTSFSEYMPMRVPDKLTVQSSMGELVAAMRAPGSGLEIKRRQWLGIEVEDAFLGSEAVDWVVENVEGAADRKEAKYAIFCG
jgi:hypothetical protein